MTPVSAYLFDMDGTLVDTERFWTIALCDLLRADGHELPFDEAYDIVHGHSWNGIYRDICRLFPDEAARSIDEQGDLLKPLYLRAREGADMRIPGSVETFLALARHTPCAIVSGSRREDVEETAQALGIRDSLSCIVSADECQAGKPAPDGFLMAARILGVEPARCVVFEDSLAGVLAGRAAGMRVVALVPPGSADPGVGPHADLLLSNLADYRPELLFR